jgi:NADPH:quinone reductase
MTKVIEISTPGAPEVLVMTDRPIPACGAGEVLIQVKASGVNRPDVLQRKGFYMPPPGASDVPGLEVAGVIVGGDSVAMAMLGFQRGDRVCALVSGGGYAEYCVAPLGQCLPTPKNLSDLEAASLPETFFTVWSNLFDRASLAASETVLIHGGASGIGVAAIQLAKAVGARVLVTAGSAEKCQACLALGADEAINYQTHDFVDEVKRVTGDRGVDVVLDMVAGSYVARELGCLADDGRLVIIAVQGGREATLDAGLILRRRLTITGSMLRPRSVDFKALIARALYQHVWPWIESGRVKPVIYRMFPADQVVAAHQLMESNQHIGKLVLAW